MSELYQNSLFAGVTISLLAYALGMFLRKKLKLGIFNPLLISIVLTIIFLACTGIEYDTYNQGAAYLSWFLTPATVCLAIPLYEQWELLKKNHRAVILGITAGVLTSLGTVLILCKLMNLSHEMYVTMLPKSITTAIGMGVSEELGGIVTITVAVIIVTGILGNVIGEDGRIHSTFNQTITATGRISSTDPNLQNIPVRMELGRLIRKVFVPEEGFVFLDADYSQIELRVLAHMSGDEKLIQAYREAEDIHRLTASQVFHVPLDEVTSLQRRNAKAVNFGIVYGISSFGLSQDLSITRKEAAAYIEKYFETYPKIKGFLDGLVKDGKEHGYVTTMFGRRRPVPELRSSNFMQRSFGERVAMNSPIQGTAADIIKIAMNHVYERMKKEGLRSRLVLQVHDELLIETKKEEIEEVSRILEEEMKGAADLAVELDVDMHQGDSWYEAK